MGFQGTWGWGEVGSRKGGACPGQGLDPRVTLLGLRTWALFHYIIELGTDKQEMPLSSPGSWPLPWAANENMGGNG